MSKNLKYCYPFFSESPLIKEAFPFIMMVDMDEETGREW